MIWILFHWLYVCDIGYISHLCKRIFTQNIDGICLSQFYLNVLKRQQWVPESCIMNMGEENMFSDVYDE